MSNTGSDRQPIRIALTAGEPAGIGPDLVVEAAQYPLGAEIVVIADPGLLQARAKMLNLPLQVALMGSPSRSERPRPGSLMVLPTPLKRAVVRGQLDAHNAAYVIETLTAACQGCLTDAFDAMVTAPVHKGIINDAAIPFTGHTEFLADLCGGQMPVMLLIAPGLRVALATTHVPLAEVSQHINSDHLVRVTRILAHDLRTRLGVPKPRIAVCGLNPHAGEGGHLGTEEIQHIAPAVQRLRAEGLEVAGPLPADTVFVPRHLKEFDAVLAMYHDQGLPVLKHKGFGEAVNITLGLPIIRTSVDHGTALDLAGTGRAESQSLLAAIRTAVEMVRYAREAQANPPR
jgi:4-hydroxythreonine-4-phosphate dehydrogenase